MIDGKIIHRKLNKMPYSGSYQGMRFYLTAKEEQIEAYVYPEPFCMEKTPDDQKIHRQFPFNEEGFEQVTDWLNQMFEEKKEFWREARKNKFLI